MQSNVSSAKVRKASNASAHRSSTEPAPAELGGTTGGAVSRGRMTSSFATRGAARRDYFGVRFWVWVAFRAAAAATATCASQAATPSRASSSRGRGCVFDSASRCRRSNARFSAAHERLQTNPFLIDGAVSASKPSEAQRAMSLSSDEEVVAPSSRAGRRSTGAADVLEASPLLQGRGRARHELDPALYGNSCQVHDFVDDFVSILALSGNRRYSRAKMPDTSAESSERTKTDFRRLTISRAGREGVTSAAAVFEETDAAIDANHEDSAF